LDLKRNKFKEEQIEQLRCIETDNRESIITKNKKNKMQKGKKFLSDLKLHSDYFKWLEDKGRYETWEEACENIIDGHRKKYSDYTKEIESYLESALDSMKDQVVLASQRNLQYRYEQIVKHNTRMFNCTSGHIARNRVFQEIFYLALSGCGFGGGLLIPFVNNLSRLQKRTKGTKTFVIQDSIEGWADSLGILMSSYFVDEQPFPEYAGYEVKFDYSQIREKGSFISGGFKAPGHEGLKQSLEKIETLVEKWITNEGEKIRPILAFDIICHSADAVLSGGVRRSALNMIVDPNDHEMIHAKTGNWFIENPQRGRSNNSVLLFRGEVTKDQFEYLVKLNDGANDIGFVFANSWFDMFNPCFEILKIPVLDTVDFSKIHYDDIEEYVKTNKHKFGIQGCNLTEINAEKCTTKEKFLKACKDASILGTLQAGYTNFPYLGETSKKIFEREALLGVSITGWMNNPKLFNAELLEEGAKVVKDTNKELAFLIDINQAARTTCVKPSGNASVVLGTASGIHPEHSEKYFRIMQLNKESNTAKWLENNMSFLLEDSVWSSTKSDYVVFVPVENPKNGLFKKDMKGIKHLELIKLVQQHWVNAGTNPELCTYSPVNHNTSCTVIIDDKDSIVEYIWRERDFFTAVSFISDYGDKDFNQAPFTSVLNLDELVSVYGKGSILASGLVVDGLHYFNNNLWSACDHLLDSTIPITGNREQVLLKKYWIERAKKFAKNYFKGDMKKMVYCLKDVHLFHKWETVTRQFKEVNFGEILDRPQYKDISDYASMACSGGSCEITKI
jgi:ribonucleoside-diphosphate reductase alpha chain